MNKGSFQNTIDDIVQVWREERFHLFYKRVQEAKEIDPDLGDMYAKSRVFQQMLAEGDNT